MKKFAIISIVALVAYPLLELAIEALKMLEHQPKIIRQIAGLIILTLWLIQQTLAVVAIIGVIYLGWAFYMYPARVAINSKHPHAGVLWVINLLFGWILIPWLICLMIANQQPAPTSPTPLANPSLEGALRELDGLKRKGIISDEEYVAKRTKILCC